jgi:dTDP-4-amino-4,6-dideoxygalactose transaminase
MDADDGPWYYEMISLGFNYRMSDISAALGISQFSRIDQNLAERNRIAKRYDEAFANDQRFITPPKAPEDALHSYHLYTLRLKDPGERKAFFAYLQEAGIHAQVHYVPMHIFPYYRENYGYKRGDFPCAEAYYESEISLPMYHSMAESDLEYVIEKVLAYGE